MRADQYNRWGKKRMTWQEYQDGVCELYAQAEGLGVVERNQHIPDRVTGQKRQVDGLLTIPTKGHTVRVLLEAKFHSSPIDVKDVEQTIALSHAVRADKAVLVVANGWTEPAFRLAQFSSMDIRLLTTEEALTSLFKRNGRCVPIASRIASCSIHPAWLSSVVCLSDGLLGVAGTAKRHVYTVRIVARS